jgi:transcriptional regulator with XRE-family HTH domain
MYPNLKMQIWRAGLRQNRLARALDIDEAALSRIVNGFREPSQELQNAMAALLDCDVAWLFEREDPPEVLGRVNVRRAAGGN